MYCQSCGEKLSEKVNYCSNCGAPTKPTAENNKEKRYKNELLQIKVKSFGQTLWGFGALKMKFQALYMGNEVIDETEVFTGNWQDGIPLLLEMQARLMAQGWEVLSTDDSGRVRTMRR